MNWCQLILHYISITTKAWHAPVEKRWIVQGFTAPNSRDINSTTLVVVGKKYVVFAAFCSLRLCCNPTPVINSTGIAGCIVFKVEKEDKYLHHVVSVCGRTKTKELDKYTTTVEINIIQTAHSGCKVTSAALNIPSSQCQLTWHDLHQKQWI